MFTGLIADIGTVREVSRAGDNFRVVVEVKALDTSTFEMGESIAVNGVCFTVVAFDGSTFAFEASPESLAVTTLSTLGSGQRVHLERALAVGSRLGGHLVQGHVDGVGKLLSTRVEGNAWHLTFWAPEAVARYLVDKGSVTIDGVSLTVNEVDARRSTFRVTIIPHTADMTLLTELTPGQGVNLEADIIGKYVARLIRGYLPGGDGREPGGAAARPASLEELLAAGGYMDVTGSGEGD